MKMIPKSVLKKEKRPGVDVLKSGNRNIDMQFQNLKERLINLEKTTS